MMNPKLPTTAEEKDQFFNWCFYHKGLPGTGDAITKEVIAEWRAWKPNNDPFESMIHWVSGQEPDLCDRFIAYVEEDKQDPVMLRVMCLKITEEVRSHTGLDITERIERFTGYRLSDDNCDALFDYLMAAADILNEVVS